MFQAGLKFTAILLPQLLNVGIAVCTTMSGANKYLSEFLRKILEQSLPYALCNLCLPEKNFLEMKNYTDNVSEIVLVKKSGE